MKKTYQIEKQSLSRRGTDNCRISATAKSAIISLKTHVMERFRRPSRSEKASLGTTPVGTTTRGHRQQTHRTVFWISMREQMVAIKDNVLKEWSFDDKKF